MGERLKRMEYKVHTYNKSPTYNSKVGEYKLPPAKKVVPYKLPDMGKKKIPDYKVKEYKYKEYRYKEYIPPWERGEVRKKKMRAVVAMMPKKANKTQNKPPVVKNEPKPKPNIQDRNKDVKPKETTPVHKREQRTVPPSRPTPTPPPTATTPLPPPARPRPRPRPLTPQRTPSPEERPPTPTPPQRHHVTPRDVDLERKTELWALVHYSPRKRIEQEARVHVHERPQQSPYPPLFKPTYTSVPRAALGPVSHHTPRNLLENLDF